MSTASVDIELEYPSSDGLPMSENTKQYNCIVTVKEGLEQLFEDRDDVFIAGDNLWYPVEGRPDIRRAPDVYVVFGRPKGDRGSYIQHLECGVPLHVVFEILSPSNRGPELRYKFDFYQKYGVEEYYVYDPDRLFWKGYQRVGEELQEIADMGSWTSPRLGIRFDVTAEEMTIIRPDGRIFLTMAQQRELLYETEAAASEQRQRAIEERQRANEERRRADALAAKLRELGIDPGTI